MALVKGNFLKLNTLPLHSPIDHRPDLSPVLMIILEGLVKNHFGKRGPGRPEQRGEFARTVKGFEGCIKASGVLLTKAQQDAVFQALVSQNLFDGATSNDKSVL